MKHRTKRGSKEYRKAWHDGELAKKHYEKHHDDTSVSMELRDTLQKPIAKDEILMGAFSGGFNYWGNIGQHKKFKNTTKGNMK